MTTSIPADPALDAPTLIGTGIDTMAQTAGRLGLSWGMKLATVVTGNDAASTDVTVLVDGDEAQMLTVPLIKRNPVYGTLETFRPLEAGDRVYVLNTPTGLLAMPVSPDQEVTAVTDLFMFDYFNTPSESGWGSPNYGPSWTATTGSSSVGGFGASIGPGTATVTLGSNPPANLSIHLLNVRPASAGSSNTLTIRARGVNIQVQVIFVHLNEAATDIRPWITAQATGQETSAVNNRLFVLGSTSATTPIDIFIKVRGSVMNVWSALNSNGINTSAPATFPMFTNFLTSGSFSISNTGGTVPMLIGGIVVRSL